MKKKLGLVGYFGWGNFGDELFLKTHVEHLGGDFELEVVHDRLTRPYFARPLQEVVERYDGIVIGGGDLINPLQVSELYWRPEYLKKPVFVFGVGVPRAKFERRDAMGTYREFFGHPNCKLTIARDPESAAWISANLQPARPVEWYPDLVCAMSRPMAVEPARKTLGVVLRSHRSLADDLSAVRTLIDRAKEYDYAIKHLVLGIMECGKSDRAIAESVAREGEEIVASESLDELCVAISSCSMLATIKFHGMVVAAMYGIPSIAMSVTPKNQNFLRMIGRPEMIGGYTQPDTYKKLSYYPAQIHPLVRGKLYRDARRGYRRLAQALHESLSAQDRGRSLAGTENYAAGAAP